MPAVYNRKLNNRLKNLTINQEIIIEERTIEIQKKSKALEQSNNEFAQFAYISAHDLREPLRNIMSFSQLLERKIKKKEFDEVDEYVTFINKSIRRMDVITKDIVNYVEIEKYVGRVDDVDVFKLVKDINEFFQIKSSKKIKFYVQKMPILNINQKLCHNIFYNLIENAIQYCKKDIPEVKIRVKNLDKFYQFSIEDNSIGIAPEYFDNIFMMFKRLHNDINKSGSGIGLSICKKIILAYGGKIWVESELGKGSVFNFTLPK